MTRGAAGWRRSTARRRRASLRWPMPVADSRSQTRSKSKCTAGCRPGRARLVVSAPAAGLSRRSSMHDFCEIADKVTGGPAGWRGCVWVAGARNAGHAFAGGRGAGEGTSTVGCWTRYGLVASWRSVDPARKRDRYYSLRWQPSIFGPCLLAEWGRAGTPSARQRAWWPTDVAEAARIEHRVIQRRAAHGYTCVARGPAWSSETERGEAEGHHPRAGATRAGRHSQALGL